MKKVLFIGRGSIGQRHYRNLKKIKKGSKAFRMMIDGAEPHYADPAELTIVKTLANLTETAIPPTNVLNNALGAWSNCFLENDFRQFIFIYIYRPGGVHVPVLLVHVLPV